MILAIWGLPFNFPDICYPVFSWQKEDKFVRKRNQGIVPYTKPVKHKFDKIHKQVQLNRQLCTAAYR